MTPDEMDRRRFLMLSGVTALAASVGRSAAAFGAQTPSDEALALLGGLTWIKHAAFRLQDGETVIYLDPWGLTTEPHDADVVLVTHSHSDHCDTGSVSAVVKDGTEIVTEPESAGKLSGMSERISAVAPGDDISVVGIRVEAVPAYNISTTFHRRSKNWLGFIITLSDGRRFYHAGDTDHIPEMSDIETDVALLPAGGTYTMTPVEAADAARAIQPGVAVPMHYGAVVGNAADAQRFEQELAGEVEVTILEEGQAVPPPSTGVWEWGWC